MNYGTQRFLDTKPLTPEQEARQKLALEAVKEQARYERNKRKQLVNKTKEAVVMLGRFTMIALLAGILIALVSCGKEDVQECITHDLGKAGEEYTPLGTGNGDGSGLPGVIYVHNGRVLQDICPF